MPTRLAMALHDCAPLLQSVTNSQEVFKIVLCLKCINEYVISVVYFSTHWFYFIIFFWLATTRATACSSCSKRFYCISANIDSFLFSTLVNFYGQRYLPVVNGDWVVSELPRKRNAQGIEVLYKLLVASVNNKCCIWCWRVNLLVVILGSRVWDRKYDFAMKIFIRSFKKNEYV